MCCTNATKRRRGRGDSVEESEGVLKHLAKDSLTRRLVASTSSVETTGGACVSANYFSAVTHPTGDCRGRIAAKMCRFGIARRLDDLSPAPPASRRRVARVFLQTIFLLWPTRPGTVEGVLKHLAKDSSTRRLDDLSPAPPASRRRVARVFLQTIFPHRLTSRNPANVHPWALDSFPWRHHDR